MIKSKNKNIKFTLYITTNIAFVIFALLTFACMIALVDANFNSFIRSVGIFFIPMLGFIDLSLYLLTIIFKYKTLKMWKAEGAIVFRLHEVNTKDFNDINNAFDKAISEKKTKNELK